MISDHGKKGEGPGQEDIVAILEAVRAGRVSIEDAAADLVIPSQSLSSASGGASPTIRIDHDRERRCGFPEVIYGAGKERDDLLSAANAILEAHGRVLVTRLDDETGAWLTEFIPGATFESRARCVIAATRPIEQRGCVAVLCAGTSDVPVAEEARVAAEISGSHTESFYDVGVAGLHRLLAIEDEIRRARVIVVVAGMEGALPSVVAGLTTRPVLAVPTSVGYGASFGGVAALLGMLNSCATGVAVLNIDNGFGAGMFASRINRLGPPGDGAESST